MKTSRGLSGRSRLPAPTRHAGPASALTHAVPLFSFETLITSISYATQPTVLTVVSNCSWHICHATLPLSLVSGSWMLSGVARHVCRHTVPSSFAFLQSTVHTALTVTPCTEKTLAQEAQEATVEQSPSLHRIINQYCVFKVLGTCRLPPLTRPACTDDVFLPPTGNLPHVAEFALMRAYYYGTQPKIGALRNRDS